MNKVFVFFACLMLVFGACTSSQTGAVQDPSGCWAYTAFLKSEQALSLHANDQLCLRTDSSFWYRLQLIGKYASGSWKVENDSLVLSYHALPVSWGVDSVVAEGDWVHYFFEGDTLCSISTEQQEVERTFVTELYTDSTWVFSEGELFFEFQKIQP